MLDAYIIEDILEREQHEEQPYLELPLYVPYDEDIQPETKEPEVERGVIVIDLL